MDGTEWHGIRGPGEEHDEGEGADSDERRRVRVGDVVGLHMFDGTSGQEIEGREMNAAYVVVAWQRGFSEFEYAQHQEEWKGRLAQSVLSASSGQDWTRAKLQGTMQAALDASPRTGKLFYLLLGDNGKDQFGNAVHGKEFHYVHEGEIETDSGFCCDAPWGPVSNVLLGKFFSRYSSKKGAYALSPEMQLLFPDR